MMAVLALACAAWAQEFDMVIANGRVMDPASGLDAVRHIGIRGGKIAAISAGSSPRANRARCERAGRGAGIHRSAFARPDAGKLPLQGDGRRHHGARNGGGSFARTPPGTRRGKARP